MPSRSKIWTEVKGQQIKIQLERFQGLYGCTTVAGITHFWRRGIPYSGICGRTIRHVDPALVETMKVCQICLELFQDKFSETFQSEVKQ